MSRHRRGGMGLGLLLLGNTLMREGFTYLPPVTLVTVVAQSLLYMGVINPPWSPAEVCLSVQAVLGWGDYRRLLLAAVEHSDDLHLYFNMASFIVKGRSLETRMGSRRFGVVLLVLTLGSSLAYVGVMEGLSRVMHDNAYRNQCAIGFSGVLFALKVLTTQLSGASHATTSFFGFRMTTPARYAVWTELVLIHVLVPRASFVGHLAGILVGLAYVGGPLAVVVDLIDGVLATVMGQTGGGRGGGRRRNDGQPSYTYTRSTVGGGSASNNENTEQDRAEDEYRSYSREDYIPPPGVSVNANSRPTQQGTASVGWNVERPRYTYASGTSGEPTTHRVPGGPSPEELRQRRLDHFQ